jgi:toxin-antitoxin system PIN domain toxin
VIAVDTNVLLYAHRSDSPWHEAATRCLRELAHRPWAIPWPCVHEFLAIATHPRIFDPPSPIEDALGALESWRAVPTTAFLAEAEGYADVLAAVLREARVVGPRVHDARIAALCRQHAVTELWTADRDFSRFPGLATRNPLA